MYFKSTYKDIHRLFKYSALKQYNFEIKLPISHQEMGVKIDNLKEKILHIPKAPFVHVNTLGFTLVCQPEGLFYAEDKKNSCILIKPFAEEAIRSIAKKCDIIIFSRKKKSTLETFVREAGNLPIKSILDKSFITYREGKKIKDLAKLGVNLDRTIVLDINH